MMSPLKQAKVPLAISLQFPRAPPVPNGSVSRTIRTSKSTWLVLKYSWMWSTLYPPATITSSTMFSGMHSTTLSRRVLSSILSNGFGIFDVHGRSLEPTPPASTTTCMIPTDWIYLLNMLYSWNKALEEYPHYSKGEFISRELVER